MISNRLRTEKNSRQLTEINLANTRRRIKKLKIHKVRNMVKTKSGTRESVAFSSEYTSKEGSYCLEKYETSESL